MLSRVSQNPLKMVGLRNCGLKIFQWNCNGLLAHVNEFKQHLAQNSCDVICLQETFLKSNKSFSLAGFSVIRKEREGSRKGGLITLIKDTLNYTEIPVQASIQCITANIKTDNSYITVTNLYISPDKSIDITELSKIFTAKSVIVGDFNSKSTLWGSPTTDERGLIIEDIVDNNDFVILNNGQPTYTHYDGSQSHLDLSLICHTLGSKSYWEVLDNTFGSDHFATTYINIYPDKETDDTQKFILSKADWELFKINSR